jgi:thioredoxin-like negative regulator of GroEL
MYLSPEGHNDQMSLGYRGRVRSLGGAALVKFWQPGCGGCRTLRRKLEQIDQEMGQWLLILLVNVQENYQIPAELDITSLPALALHRNGRLIGSSEAWEKTKSSHSSMRLQA